MSYPLEFDQMQMFSPVQSAVTVNQVTTGKIRAMKVTSLTIRGFRCFDDAGETIPLDHLTCLVGPNASGKTAAMMALVRLFGEHPSQRQLTTDDFHLGRNEGLADKKSRTLSIECRIDFPELVSADPTTSRAVPESFNQMIVEAQDAPPFCRLRLEGVWTNDGTPEGDIEQSLKWILTPSDDPEVIANGHTVKAQAEVRRRVRVVYVPATRDPERQISITASTSFGRLLKALSLGGAEGALKSGLKAIQDEIGKLRGVSTLNVEMQSAWSRLYEGRVARNVAFQALEGEPADLLALLTAHFAPGENERPILSDKLSDGLRSLFSLALSLCLTEVEQRLLADPKSAGFKEELAEEVPCVTIFAVEEPENHLSPQYLGRVIRQLDDVSRKPHAQVLVSSHSPAILGRVQPDNVRYFLGNEHSAATRVKRILLPKKESDEAFKFVREAVRAHPELYFARLVIFGEGPSEEIVLKRLLEASGTPLDSHFITFAPLGGRHVNHFWRLVRGLDIPHITLLDLDWEKEGAGWGRIQYVRDQLVKRFGRNSPALKFKFGKHKEVDLGDEQYGKLAKKLVSQKVARDQWLRRLEKKFRVFFSSPLDIDFAMLEAFPDIYKSQSKHGLRLPDSKTSAKAREKAVHERIVKVLGGTPGGTKDTTGSTYSLEQRELFPWYKHLFMDGSKPVAHARAMIAIPDEDLLRSAPAVLLRLVEAARKLVEPKTEEA